LRKHLRSNHSAVCADKLAGGLNCDPIVLVYQCGLGDIVLQPTLHAPISKIKVCPDRLTRFRILKGFLLLISLTIRGLAKISQSASHSTGESPWINTGLLKSITSASPFRNNHSLFLHWTNPPGSILTQKGLARGRQAPTTLRRESVTSAYNSSQG
jgi:hypothetical protein